MNTQFLEYVRQQLMVAILSKKDEGAPEKQSLPKKAGENE